MKMIIPKTYTTEELQKLAFTDALTGVYNRNVLDAARKTFGKTLLWVTIVDIDNLKFINDTYGHLAGDLTIRAIVKRLTELAQDIIRLGGDEFLLLSDNEIIGPIIGASHGSVLKEEGTSLTRAMEAADEKLRQVKRDKRNGR